MPTNRTRRNKKIQRRKHKRKPMHSTNKKSNGNIPTNGRKQQTHLTVYIPKPLVRLLAEKLKNKRIPKQRSSNSVIILC